MHQDDTRAAQSFRKITRGRMAAAAQIVDQRMEQEARINNDFGRERIIGKEMPIRGQLRIALSLGHFHDSVQSGLPN